MDPSLDPRAASPVSLGSWASSRARFLLARLGKTAWANPRRIAHVVCWLLVVGGAGSLWLLPWLRGEYYWRQAKQALAAHDFALARAHLSACLRFRPRSAAAQFEMARTCRRADDLASWERHLREARILHWSPDAIWREEQLAQAQTGAIEEVGVVLQQYLDGRYEDEGVVLEAVVKGYLESFRLQDVVRWATHWSQRQPADWQPHYYRGRAFAIHRWPAQAIRDYKSALSLQPEQNQVRLALASVLAASGQDGEGLELYQACVRSDPRDKIALLGVAYCLRSLGHSAEGLAVLDELFALEAEHAGGNFLRAQILLDQDRPDEALVCLQIVERKAPLDRHIAYTRSRCLWLLGKEEEAQASDREANRLKKMSERLEALTEEITLKPADISLRQESATLLLGLGRYQEAARRLQSILQIDPDYRPAHAAMATCLNELGQPLLAARHRRLAEAPGKR